MVKLQSELTPIFIFSLPRAGSTLLQRVLTTHEEISSASEPWILLPIIYALKKDGVYAEYSHQGECRALTDFLMCLPNKEEDYYKAMSTAILSVYQKVNDTDVKYFLDKTPRYTLISDEIIRMFPDSKNIFLWRNPLAVAASMIETWGEGKWNLYQFKIDLFSGLTQSIESFINNQEKTLSINYESFLCNPELEMGRLGEYLELSFDLEDLTKFSQIKFNGHMGDPTGIHQYKSFNKEPINKWKSTICNPFRKWWCKRYLKWLGEERIRIMGYDMNSLIAELESIPFSLKWQMSDIFNSVYGVAYCLFEPTIMKQKFQRLRKWDLIRRHK